MGLARLSARGRRTSASTLRAHGLAAVFGLALLTSPYAPPPVAVPAPVPVPSLPSLPAVQADVDRAGWLVSGERGIPPSSSSEPSGSFRMVCGFSHFRYDDPIVFPGQSGASHLHMFWGNSETNFASTYQSMRTTGSGTCPGGPLNRTGYWVPAMHDADGKVVVPKYTELYYLGSGSQEMIRNIQTMPNGLRMVAGYDMRGPNDLPHTLPATWQCVVDNEPTVTAESLVGMQCPAGAEIRAFQRFPMCWDGKNLDSPNHRSHMAYGTGGGGFVTRTGGCPATHPVHLPEVTEFVDYESDGNVSNWYLASDRMPGMVHANGSTMHADWFGAWDNDVQETFTQNCIREMRNCINGELGDGTALRNFQGTYDGPTLTEAPSITPSGGRVETTLDGAAVPTRVARRCSSSCVAV